MNRAKNHCNRRRLSLKMCFAFALAAGLARFAPAVAAAQSTLNVVVQWNIAALQGVRDSKLGPPMVARALAIVHTCAYDSWALLGSRTFAQSRNQDCRCAGCSAFEAHSSSRHQAAQSVLRNPVHNSVTCKRVLFDLET